MEVNLEKSKLANSKMDNKPNISSVKPGKNNEVNIQTEKLNEKNILDFLSL